MHTEKSLDFSVSRENECYCFQLCRTHCGTVESKNWQCSLPFRLPVNVRSKLISRLIDDKKPVPDPMLRLTVYKHHRYMERGGGGWWIRAISDSRGEDGVGPDGRPAVKADRPDPRGATGHSGALHAMCNRRKSTAGQKVVHQPLDSGRGQRGRRAFPSAAVVPARKGLLQAHLCRS